MKERDGAVLRVVEIPTMLAEGVNVCTWGNGIKPCKSIVAGGALDFFSHAPCSKMDFPKIGLKL